MRPSSSKSRRLARRWADGALLVLLAAAPLVGAPAVAGAATPTYTFSSPTMAVDNAMAGLSPDDHSQPAAVDPCAMRTPSAGVRLIFTSAGQTIRSAVSNDGRTFTMDPAFVAPVILRDDGQPGYGYGHCTVVARPGGGYRMFLRGDGPVVRTATSSDGRVWTAEPGVRFDGAALGLERITGPSVVRMKNGLWRMYFSTETTDSTSAIYSATSRDQLTWKGDARILIGPGARYLTWNANHPKALRQPDGSITLVWSVHSIPGKPGYVPGRAGRIVYSTAADGVTFKKLKESKVGVRIPVDPDLKGDDPGLLALGKGRVLLYFNVFWPPGGDQTYVAHGRLVD